MTPDEAIRELNELDGSDQEAARSIADQILCQVLESLGHKDVVEAWDNAYNRVVFWRAS